jgi:hypothetical protein
MPARQNLLPHTDLAPWMRNAFTLWEISFAAPQVIAHRVARMAQAGPSPGARDQKEFVRMGQEKAEAFVESMWGMGLRIGQAQVAMAASMFAQWLRLASSVTFPTPMWTSAMPSLVATGLRPVHRRVTANARRLGKVPARRRRTGSK